jgi:hypothetical protein
MKRLTQGLVGTLLIAFVAVGCSDYVQNVEKPIGSVSDAELNSPSDVLPFIRGMETSFAAVYGEGSLNNGGLSDEMIFTTAVRGATFPSYAQIDNGGVGVLVPANNNVQNGWRSLTQFRYLADHLIVRSTSIKNALDENSPTYAEDAAQCDEGVFYGHLYGAIARGMMADHWSLDNTGPGGGVLDATTLGSGNSPFIPAATLRTQARELLASAVGIAPSPALAAICNTLIARMHLYEGNYAEAATAAASGMQSGAAPLTANCNEATRNAWYDGAGFGRDQFMADQRFRGYVTADATEAGRIPLAVRIGADRVTQFWQQNKYTEFSSPISYITWQENHLMLAELAIRNNDNPTALGLINAVRASHGVSDMTDERVQSDFAGNYLDMLFTERDKELCFTGMRAQDQIRFGKWHKPDESVVWKWLPISQQERNGNPNFD